MSLFSALSSRFISTMEKRAAIRVWYHLQGVDADSILRAGISPELLAQGPQAYPWRATGQANTVAAVSTRFNKKQLRDAAAELRACSDAELRELGIARNNIDHVVKYGRDNIAA